MQWLSVDWSHERVTGVVAEVKGSAVSVTSAFECDVPEAVHLSNPQQCGIWLKSILNERKLKPERLLVCLPRNEAVVKRLELPSVTDAELPQLVAFQAASRSSLPLSDLTLDFIPWPLREGFAGREVLTATVPNSTADAIRSIAQAVGVKQASLTLAAVGWGELLLRRGVADDQLTVVVHRLAERLEVSIFRGGVLLLCHAAHVHAAERAELHRSIVSEVSRAAMSIRSFEPTAAMSQLIVSGDDEKQEELIATLGKRVGCPAKRMETQSEISPAILGSVRPAAIAAPFGHLLYKASPKSVGLDLLSPRQPPKPIDTSRARNIALAVGGGVVAVALGVGYWLWMSDLESTAESRRNMLAQLTESNTKGQPTVDSAKLVDSWLAEEVRWDKSLDEITQLLPENKTLYVTKLSGDSKATGDVKSFLKVEGFTRERGDAQKLAGAINSVATDRLLVPPPKARASTRDDKYPFAFEAEIQWLRKKGDGKTTAKAGVGKSLDTKSTDSKAAETKAAASSTPESLPANSKAAETQAAETRDSATKGEKSAAEKSATDKPATEETESKEPASDRSSETKPGAAP